MNTFPTPDGLSPRHETQTPQAGSKMGRRGDHAASIIADLLQAMPEAVRNATDNDLLSAFLAMDAAQEVRDTAQVVLEARKYIRDRS